MKLKSNQGMRALIEERKLVGLDVAFCQRCRDDLLEQILGNYRALQRFDEGARFRSGLGTTQDVPRWRERWGGPATYSSSLLLGRTTGMHPHLPGGRDVVACVEGGDVCHAPTVMRCVSSSAVRRELFTCCPGHQVPRRPGHG